MIGEPGARHAAGPARSPGRRAMQRWFGAGRRLGREDPPTRRPTRRPAPTTPPGTAGARPRGGRHGHGCDAGMAIGAPER